MDLIAIDDVKLTDGKLVGLTATVIKTIQENLAQDKLVVFPGLWSKDMLEGARAELKQFSASQDPINTDITEGCKNFHRFDESEKNSKILLPRTLHRFFFLHWNVNPKSSIDTIGSNTVTLRNVALGKSPTSFMESLKEGFFTHWTVSHYPIGGGWLADHSDPLEPAGAEVGVCLSRFGRDFSSGGFWIQDRTGTRHYIDKILSEGDMYLFKQDLLHGVSPVDPEKSLDWSLDQGRISLFSPVRPTPWL